MFGLVPFERNELWNPFREFEDNFFKGFGNMTHCRTDIKDEGDKFVLECEMPVFNKEDIQIDINGSTLTLLRHVKLITARRPAAANISAGNAATVPIAEALIFRALMKNTIVAVYTNSILTLTLPKKEKQQLESKRIEIK